MLEQPYEYSARELVEPDWRRLPGFADVTEEQWRSAQWQRVNCVKNLRQLRGVYGDLLDESFYARRRGRPGRPRHDVAAAAAADAQHDGARRRADDGRDAGRPGAPVHAPGAVRPAARRGGEPPVRRPRLAARARDVGGRGADPPLPHQGAGRAALDLPAVLRPLHPHGPGGQLDARRPQAEVRAQAGRPAGPDARLPARHPGRPRRRRLRRRRRQPAVQEPRGVRRRPARDRVGPRHPAGDQGPHGHAPALAAGRRRRGHDPAGDDRPRPRRLPRHPHPRQRRPVGDAAGRRGRAGDARGRRARRPQPGRAAQGRQRLGRPAARPLLRAARRRRRSRPTTSTCAT